MRVAVAIVNFNGGEHIMACLAALARQTYPHRVLVVDNASVDGSPRAIHDAYPGAHILPLRRNVGFARAVNLAAERATADVLVTLNPDTIPDPAFIEEIVKPLMADDRLASVAGTLVFASAPSVVASAGVRIHRNGVALDDMLGEAYDAGAPPARAVFGPSAGAAAYRLEAFKAVGGLCEPFFLYLEDVDLAWRFRLMGWESVNANAALASHVYSASAVEGSPFKRRLQARNRIWSLARCLPTALWKRDRRQILAFDLRAAGFAVFHRDTASLRGRLDGLAAFPLRLRERRLVQSAATAPIEELDRWLLPSVTPRELLALRRLTGRLAGQERR
jgi:GT2 family glycosyltransferase